MRSSKERLAYVLRILSAPPLMAVVLFAILYAGKPTAFGSAWDLAVPVFGLALVPASAYPLSLLLPSIRRRGREGQRNLAFICSAVGYVGTWLYSLLSACSAAVALICTIYLLSVLLLLAANKQFHIRASGHASGFAGPMIVLSASFGLPALAVCVPCYCLVLWSSVVSKRHTVSEFVLGTVLCAAACGISYFLFSSLGLV